MFKTALLIILIMGLGCTPPESEAALPPNTGVVEFGTTYHNLAAYGFITDPRIDDWSRLNPDHFILTNLNEVIGGDQVKSRVTGKVYQCYLKKGDVLKIPTYSPESSDPRYKFWSPRGER